MCQEHSRKYHKQELQSVMFPRRQLHCSRGTGKLASSAYGEGIPSPRLLGPALHDSLSKGLSIGECQTVALSLF